MLEYYEPLLDLSSPERFNAMGLIVSLNEPVDGEILRSAVEALRVRFPYFYVRAARRGSDIITEPNPLPMTVRSTWEPILLNAAESNYHLGAWKYDGRRLAFELPHALTDGAGVLPYFKSVLFLYLSRKTGKALDPAGFRLPGDGIPESETGDPFRDLDLGSVKAPLYSKKPIPDFFRLAGETPVDKRVFYIRIPEAQFMAYCRNKDASPNVMFSFLLAKGARRYDPDSRKPVTVFVAIDHKALLGNFDNYRLFVANGLLDFPPGLDLDDISRTCTMIHGQLILQAQPENSLWAIRQRKQNPPAFHPDIPQATLCVSYPKSRSFGPLDPYIEEFYITTSLLKMTDVLCEVICINHSFFVAFMQPFASTEYLDCFFGELRLAGIPYELLFSEPLRMCGAQPMDEATQ